MRKIDEFLGKFKQILKYDEDIKSGIILSIKSIIGAEIQTKDIKLQKGVLYIKGSPQLKNEIYIKKQQLLEELNNRIQKKISDIR